MKELKVLEEGELHTYYGGFVPVVILGVTYSAKSVAAYFGAVAAGSSAITLAAISDNQ